MASVLAGERVLSISRASGRQCVPPGHDKRQNGQPNRISTTRFTLATWLPKSLFVQFQRAANIYFLFISAIVLLDFSPIMWSSTVLPFCGVLLWTALKDMYEDMRRRRDDDAENLRHCFRWDFTRKQFTTAKWCDVLCGDILLGLQDEPFPADALVLYANRGQAYISTVNLDGETNLKERRAADALSAITDTLTQGSNVRSLTSGKDEAVAHELVQALAAQAAEMVLEQGLEAKLAAPKAGLVDMDGSLSLKTPTNAASKALSEHKVAMPCPLNYEHFVPRGCVLRNIPYVVSMAAYVGPDTKTRLNCAQTRAKISNMQHYLNRGVQGLVITLCLFNIYAAIWAEIEGVENPEKWPTSWPAPATRFIVYFIILYQIVPISLYVLFEIIKLLLGMQVNKDPQMVDPRTGRAALARTADLVEEMGQVNFVFSDKTGTLTENEMILARCCIHGHDLGDFRPQFPSTTTKAEVGSKQQERIKQILSSPDCNLHAEVRWFFLCMATCHNAQVEPALDPSARPHFSGTSPDEVAFLESASSVGVTFTSRERLPGRPGWQLRLREPSSEQELIFEIICEIPFTSDRKRMSVICQRGDQVVCICKGADSVMQDLCEKQLGIADSDHLAEYSKSGLRTLVFASKVLERGFVEEWHSRYVQAQTKAEGREEAMAEVAAEVEHSFSIVGISAIEDKLQEGVPEAIVTIKKAGIRFWVLTGDKTETAVEIVRACQLFTEDMLLVSLLSCTGPDHSLALLKSAQEKIEVAQGGIGLVLDGTFVGAVLQADGGSALLYTLAMASRACVCCRLSPQQKRKLVELIKAHNKRGITLAIGDGANDVSMLQGAHVGIGIHGKEGNQAVQASDVAISQFRFLVPLLLCHGRRAYRRVSVFLCYILYKHIVLAMGDMIWAHQCSTRFSGQIAYPEWMSSAFPALITGLPVIVAIGYDRDLPDEIVPLCPEIYMAGIDRLYFNARVFVMWVLSAVWHGTLAWLVPSLWVGTNAATAHLPPDYSPVEFWKASSCSFIMVITFINTRLWLYSYSPFAKHTILVMAFSFLMLFSCLFGLGYTSIGEAMQPQLAGIPGVIVSDWKYLQVMVVTPLFLLLDVLVLFLWGLIRPSPLELALRRYRRGELKAVPWQKTSAIEVSTTAPVPGTAEEEIMEDYAKVRA